MYTIAFNVKKVMYFICNEDRKAILHLDTCIGDFQEKNAHTTGTR